MRSFREAFGFLFSPARPGAPALVHPEEAAYGAIARHAWAVAAALRASGVPPGTVALPVLPKGRNFCGAFFGALLARMVPLLMETSNRADLSGAAGRARLVLTDAASQQEMETAFPGVPVLAVDRVPEADAPPRPEGPAFAPHETMVVLLTSGSTGEPKENLKSFSNVLDELALLGDLHAVTADDIYWCAVPWVHIYGFLNGFMLPLMAGARIAAPNMFLPREAEAHLARCTVLLGVPVQYRVLLETADLSGTGLRICFSSGAHLSDDLGRRFHEATGLPVTEIYGSTEMGGFAWRKNPLEKGWTPFPGMSWKVGEEDELLVRSPLMHATALDEAPSGGGWYPSGDCVKVLEDGTFLLEGRRGNIIKVAGRRVSVKEVEEGLFATGMVADAVVHPFYDEKAGCDKIGALVVLKRGAAGGRRAIRKKCAETLAAHKIPDRIRLVKKIPRTQAGKVRLRDLKTR